ncbi:hypothetical protein CSA08_01580 [Candidatus Gracilibacteria bacterium]|nr:MAG: hypothetical protein CSA08_01580 [Candidatus Gracilibacteria bacterium]
MEKIEFDEDNIVPEGFFQWYLMLDRLKNDVFEEVDFLLRVNDFFGAVLYFETQTSYNSSKVWH